MAIITCAKIARQNNGNDIDEQRLLHENGSNNKKHNIDIRLCKTQSKYNNDKQQKRDKIMERQIMKITKDQGIKIKKAILDRGYSITGFCRIHNISDRQFYAWLAGTNGYERNGIGKHFQEITDALLADNECINKERSDK